MSTPTQTPEQASPEGTLRRSRLDDVEGVVLSQVRPTSNRPALLLAGAAVVLAVLLDLVGGLHVAAALALAFLAYVISVYVVYRQLGGPRVAADQLVRALVYFAFVCAIVPLVSLLWTVTSMGAARAFDPAYLTQTMNGVTGLHDQQYMDGSGPFVGGAYHAILGTLIITGLATLISVPIGMFTAIYLVEYGGGNPLSRLIRFFVDVMTGIPSIVAGLFAFALFVQIMGPRDAKMGIAGAIALSVLMIPTVVRNSEEMLRIVPNELREASLALGVPKWRTIAKVVLPTAASGLASGVTLAIARVIGETAPLLVAVGYARALNVNPFDGAVNTLAVYAYHMFTKPLSPAVREPSLERAWAAALLLVLIVVALNLLARLIAKMFAPKTGR